MSGGCACVQSVWMVCSVCMCVCCNNKQQAEGSNNGYTCCCPRPNTRQSATASFGFGTWREGVLEGGGVAGFRFAWLARLEPSVSKRAGGGRRGTPRGLIWLA